MSLQPPTVVISAPQGAGKTRNAEALRVMFGCTSVVDGWDGIRQVPPGALVLTSLAVTPDTDHPQKQAV